VGGHLTALRRTRIGALSVADALAFPRLNDDEARARAWRTPLELLTHLPRVQVGADEAERLRSGQSVPLDGGAEGLKGPVAVAAEDRLVAVGEWDGEGLRPRKVFPRD
jgi:tRNA pseudouridine55 synthase